MWHIFKKNFSRGMTEYDITLEELKLLQLKGAIIIDVRNNREFKEGHIAQSINIPEYEINKSFENIIKDKQKPIVLYCSSGYRSVKALKKIKKMGFLYVYNLYGGLENY